MSTYLPWKKRYDIWKINTPNINAIILIKNMILLTHFVKVTRKIFMEDEIIFIFIF